MTFDETMKLWFPLGFEDYDGNLSEHHLKAAWNAAIASSLNAAEAVVRSNVDENDVHVYIIEDIRHLKTK